MIDLAVLSLILSSISLMVSGGMAFQKTLKGKCKWKDFSIDIDASTTATVKEQIAQPKLSPVA